MDVCKTEIKIKEFEPTSKPFKDQIDVPNPYRTKPNFEPVHLLSLVTDETAKTVKDKVTKRAANNAFIDAPYADTIVLGLAT